MRARFKRPQVAAMVIASVMVGLVLSPIPTITRAAQPGAVRAEASGTPEMGIIITFNPPTATRTPTPINIGNFVWDDLDHDGRQDAGEPGLSGVTVQLWNSGKTLLIDSAVTNGNGNYTVVAPIPGNYRLRVVLPGFLDSFSPKDQAGGNDQLDSDINPSGTNIGFTDIFNLASNVISTSIYDTGIMVYRPPTPTRTPTPIRIGNRVWYDWNGDGVQTDGEPGVAGITVQLWNDAKSLLIASAVTNAYGEYEVYAPTPGTYRLRVALAQGASFTLRDQGDDQLDSDFYVSGPNYGFTASMVLGSNLISTNVYDAGLVSLPTVTSTPTFMDRLWVPIVQK